MLITKTIKIVASNHIAKYYIKKGYKLKQRWNKKEKRFVNVFGTKLTIRTLDLKRNSCEIIKFKCDKCIKVIKCEYRAFYPQRNKKNHYCYECRVRKKSEKIRNSIQKKCTKCKKIKSKSRFSFNRNSPDKKKAHCKNCEPKQIYDKYKTYQKSYGLNKTEYNKLIKSQDYKCKICYKHTDDIKDNKKLCIDHDHNTKKVRGLLCSKCNTGLGFFNEDIESLRNAIIYLELYAN